MRIRLLLLPAIVMCLVSVGSAADLGRNFEQGNKHYADGAYKQAIDEYEQILKAGYQSSAVFYNLGNAYFRDGQLGMAIMNYVRAQRLAPRDDDIKTNLEFARQFAIDKIEVTEETIILEYINRIFDGFTINEITWLAAICYLLTIAIILVRYIYRVYRIPTPVFVVVVAAFALTVVLTGVKLDRDVLTRKGVVVAQQVEVKSGPGEDLSSKFTAHAGLIFNIDGEEEGYFRVNFENRLTGWIPKSATEEI